MTATDAAHIFNDKPVLLPPVTPHTFPGERSAEPVRHALKGSAAC